MVKVIASVLSAGMLLLSGIEVLSGESVVNRVVATVGGDVITYYDIMERLLPALQEAGLEYGRDKDSIRVKRLEETILNDLINNKLIEHEAEHYKIQVTDAEVDSEMRKIARENGITLDVLLRQIEFQGNTEKQFREQLKENLLRQRVVGAFVFRKIVVTVNDVESYYQKHKEEYREDKEYNLRYISFPNKEEAERILQNIKAGGASYSTIEKQYSSSPYVSGELGSFVNSELSPSWQYVLEPAEEGATVGVLPVEDKYYLLYIEKLNKGKILPLSEVYGTIEQKIRDSRFAATYASFVETLRKKTDVTLYN